MYVAREKNRNVITTGDNMHSALLDAVVSEEDVELGEDAHAEGVDVLWCGRRKI